MPTSGVSPIIIMWVLSIDSNPSSSAPNPIIGSPTLPIKQCLNSRLSCLNVNPTTSSSKAHHIASPLNQPKPRRVPEACFVSKPPCRIPPAERSSMTVGCSPPPKSSWIITDKWMDGWVDGYMVGWMPGLMRASKKKTKNGWMTDSTSRNPTQMPPNANSINNIQPRQLLAPCYLDQ